MRILAVDVGTGTQDILLFDSSKAVENCVKMIMPSPTSIVAERLYRATAHRRPVFLCGVTMGGGPNKRALARHTEMGLAAYATIDAALTFDDDLEEVKRMGVTIVAPDEVPRVNDLETIELKDVDLRAIRQALAAFGVDHRFDAISIAVLDHGFAPYMSNRLFRFEHLRRVVAKKGNLTAFCYLTPELPEYLTRMKAVVRSIEADVPLLILDTGVAAMLGALQDEAVSQHEHLLLMNLGNAHAVAFHLRDGLIQGCFEHHTRLVNSLILDSLVTELTQGTLTSEEVYNAGGHGALVVRGCQDSPFLGITGPRQDVMMESRLKPHRAVPHGDIMLSGCYGLVSACALRIDAWREEIQRTLARNTMKKA